MLHRYFTAFENGTMTEETDGQRLTTLRTVPSRLTVAHLQRLLAEGARSAGPPPIPSGEAGDPIEVDRLVNGTGLISLAGRQHPIGYHFAGDA